MNKKPFWLVTLLLLAAGTFAQTPAQKAPRIGFLGAASPSSNPAARANRLIK